ncbi:MAG: BTAD domain-containing putative transcriptional regulator [Mycobacterium sp.]
MDSGRVAFGVLGPLQATVAGTPVTLGPRKQRAVLAMLVINRNRVVSSAALLAAVWGLSATADTRASLHTYVSNLRRGLTHAGADGRAVLTGTSAGYCLRVSDNDCDIGRFAEQKAAGIRAATTGRFEEAAGHLSAAVSEWRGRVLEDLPDFDFVEAFAAALAEDDIAVRITRAEAEIACGRAHNLIGGLEALAAEHPYREQLWAQLITAYYASERQSDALDAYRRLNAALVADLGVGPGPSIRALHERILRQEVVDVRRAALTAAQTLDRRSTATGRWTAARLRTPAGEVYPVNGAATRIGRLADNDVVLDGLDVSRHHAVLSDTGTAFVITDLRSANGVYVNGSRARGSVMLADGDRIRICDHEFVFEIGSGLTQ